jgi:hypothetical protein
MQPTGQFMLYYILIVSITVWMLHGGNVAIFQEINRFIGRPPIHQPSAIHQHIWHEHTYHLIDLPMSMLLAAAMQIGVHTQH